ncbi:hypothetical protein [Leucobacter aridicollis]|uniref:Head-to-tail stopper n=1 Tax=Leucobacter aridicollis TaxID=283878 RepID=A0A852R0L3_9MICO|nr:hypothetical protein [Leucobacter aridicollis]MBL3682655.1 hypothetical protein [Leucobacter aridicollis]NYD26087.1 hypothetical protein [Leucobacter aridicollis]
MLIRERFTVGYRERLMSTGGMAPKESWKPAVDLEVFGWGPPAPDDVVRAEQTGTKHELDVYCRSSPTKHRDKLVVNGVEWFVQGEPDDYRFGPFGFDAGVRVRLSRVEG